ncbi:MAG TPA: hypothetical protein VJ792_03835, partial [Candidatus Nitrosotalea sp.]|nr:hypothetical protein [Candidatus Nitrosotalea sp.]
AFKASEQASGTFTPFPLEFSAQYGGDGTRHYPAEAHAESSMSLYALPLPPPQMQSTVTPPEVNITQGSSATVRISIKPMVEQWDVTHLNPYLDRLPCGITYEMVQVSDNDTSSTTHPAVFDFVLKAASYSQEGRYYVGVEQNGTNNQVDREVGTFILNTLKTK